MKVKNDNKIEEEIPLEVAKAHLKMEMPSKNDELLFLNEEDELISDIDEGWAWVVLLGAFLAFAVLSGLYSTFNIYYVEFLREFGKTKSVTAWVGSVYTAVFYLGGPLATLIILRWGCRVTIMSGGIIASLGFILASISNSLEALIFTQGIIAALGLSLNFAGWIIALGLYFDKKYSLGTGLAMTGFGVGLFFLGPAMQANVNYYTWRGSLLINAGLALHFCVFGALVFPITEEQLEIHYRKTKKHVMEMILSTGQQTPEILLDGFKNTGTFGEHLPRSTEHSPTMMYSPLASFLSHSVRSISETSKTQYSSIFSSRRPSVSSFTSLPGTSRITQSLENLDIDMSDDFRIRSNSMVERPLRRYTVGTTTKQAALSAEPKVIVKNGDEKDGEQSGTRSRRRYTPTKGGNLLEVPKLSNFSNIDEVNEDDQEEQAGDKQETKVETIEEEPEGPVASFEITSHDDQDEPDLTRVELQDDQLPPVQQKKMEVFLEVCWSPGLFQDVRLWCFAASGFAWMLGTNTMFIFYKHIASNMGITDRFIYALSGIGIGDLFGRLLAATISSWSWVNNVFYYGLSQMICGIVILQHVNISTAEELIMMCVLLGASYGQLNVLLAVAPAQVYGSQNLTTVFGYVLLFCGLGVLSGPPVAGNILDTYGVSAYNAVYIIAGICTLIGSVLTLLCFIIDNERLQNKIRKMMSKLRPRSQKKEQQTKI